jgi:C4-dicarboxylate transporter DctQ subunit
MVWMTFTAIPLAWRKSEDGLDEFVRVDLATRMFPRRIAFLVEVLSLLAILVFLLLLGWKGLELAQRSAGQLLASINISFFWIYLSIPVGCALMCLATLERIAILLLNSGNQDAPPPRQVS